MVGEKEGCLLRPAKRDVMRGGAVGSEREGKDDV